MEHFECISLDSPPLKLDFYVRYIDDTNVKLSHGTKDLNKFV